MSNQTSGIVAKIISKPAGNTGGTAYNFVIVEAGKDVWYGHGFAPTKFQEGDHITFSWTASGNFKNVDARSVRVGSAPAQSQQQQQAAPVAAQGGGGRFNSTQLAIQYQASRNAAIHLLDVMVTAGALPLPTKKGDQYDAILAIVDDITNQFHTKTDKVVANEGLVLEDLEIAITNNDTFN